MSIRSVFQNFFVGHCTHESVFVNVCKCVYSLFIKLLPHTKADSAFLYLLLHMVSMVSYDIDPLLVRKCVHLYILRFVYVLHKL